MTTLSHFWRIPVKTRVFLQQSMNNILTMLAALGITVKFVKDWLCLNSRILHVSILAIQLSSKKTSDSVCDKDAIHSFFYKKLANLSDIHLLNQTV